MGAKNKNFGQNLKHEPLSFCYILDKLYYCPHKIVRKNFLRTPKFFSANLFRPQFSPQILISAKNLRTKKNRPQIFCGH